MRARARPADVELRAAGYLDAGSGNVLLQGPAADLSERWRSFLRRVLRPYYTLVVEPPLFMGERPLAASGYLEHFPQQVLSAAGSRRGSHARQFVTPAACLHLYAMLAKRRLGPRGLGVFIEAKCGRHENGRWRFPFRLSGFRMVELVVLGDAHAVERRRLALREAVGVAMREVGFDGEWRRASDAFFLGNAPGARLLQRLRGTKQEYRVRLPRGALALASLNRHEDYFGEAFAIRSGRGIAQSCCAAFGIERLTAYGLLRWGARARSWPREFAG